MRTSTQQSPRSGSASPHPLAKTRIPEVWFSRVKEQLARTHSSIACEGCLSLLRRGKTRLEVYRAFGAGGAVFALFLLTKRRERKTFSSPLLAAKVEQNCQPELTKTMLRAVGSMVRKEAVSPAMIATGPLPEPVLNLIGYRLCRRCKLLCLGDFEF